MSNGHKSILFSSFHNYLDMSSGAAISARAALLGLARNGWRVRVLCGGFFDDSDRKFEELYTELIGRGFKPTVTTKRLTTRGKTIDFRTIDFRDSGIESSVIFVLDPGKRKHIRELTQAETDLLLYLYDEECANRCPDVFMTYGGYRAVATSAGIFKKHDVKTVFYLCNLAYRDRALFEEFDEVVVPSVFAKNRYKERLGIDSVVIPPLIEKNAVIAPSCKKRFLTYVNPSTAKGLDFVATLFRALGEQRPDIPALMVQGRAPLRDIVDRIGKTKLNELRIMRGVVDPVAYYRVARVMIAPSVCEETFGRVVVEAGFNRIPCICSNRGALPETGGEDGIALPLPGVGETSGDDCVDSWIRTITRFWDDEKYYQETCEKAFSNANRFDEKNVEITTIRFFEEILMK